jgi:hypothetical protein
MKAGYDHDLSTYDLEVQLIAKRPKVYTTYVAQSRRANHAVDSRISLKMTFGSLDRPQQINDSAWHSRKQPVDRLIYIVCSLSRIDDRKGHSLILLRAAISSSVNFL